MNSYSLGACVVKEILIDKQTIVDCINKHLHFINNNYYLPIF